jgi:hypothetical protein
MFVCSSVNSTHTVNFRSILDVYQTKGPWNVWTLDPAAVNGTCMCGAREETFLPRGGRNSEGMKPVWRRGTLHIPDTLLQGLTTKRVSMLHFESIVLIHTPTVKSLCVCTAYMSLFFRKINLCIFQQHALILFFSLKKTRPTSGRGWIYNC